MENNKKYNAAHPPFAFRFATTRLRKIVNTEARRRHQTIGGLINCALEHYLLAGAITNGNGNAMNGTEVK